MAQAQASNFQQKVEQHTDWVQLLASLPKSDKSTAIGQKNAKLNRNKDIHPYDCNRIQLIGLDNDYINASRISVEDAKRNYIMAQSPTQQTKDRFWLMVWQQQCPGVVMLGRCDSDGLDCYQYFPTKLNETMELNFPKKGGNAKPFVKLESLRSDQTEYVISEFTINYDNKAHIVKHIQYNNWTIKGLPSSMGSFMKFLFTVRTSVNQSSKEPLVIHCSRGSGRSGSFALIDTCLSVTAASRSSKSVDIMKYLMQMRKHRMELVETSEQLKFCFEAVKQGAELMEKANWDEAKAISQEQTIKRKISLFKSDEQRRPACLPLQGRRQQQSLKLELQKDCNEINDWWMYYEHVNDFSNTLSAVKLKIVGAADKNRDLNKWRKVLPYDDNRIILKGIDPDYINASPVKVESAKRHYIIAQAPSEQSCGRLWLMALQEKCSAIVMLCQLKEPKDFKGLEENCAEYYPQKLSTSKQFDLPNQQKVTVTLTSCAEYDSYCIRKFQVSNGNTQRNISHYQFTKWGDGDKPQSEESFLDFLFTIRTEGHMADMTAPLIVHCSAGIGRSGSFALIDVCLALVAQNKSTNGVDLMDQLKAMREQRDTLVHNPVQLKFCFEAAKLGAELLEKAGWDEKKLKFQNTKAGGSAQCSK